MQNISKTSGSLASLGIMLVACILILSGCTMAPDYHRPEAPVPEAFPAYESYSHAKVTDEKADPNAAEAWDSDKVAPLEAASGVAGTDGAIDLAKVKEQNSELPAAMNISWNQFFEDPTLNRLIELALDENRDLRVAMLTVDSMREAYKIQRADLVPAVSASGSNSNQRLPADVAGAPDHIVSRQSSATVGITSFELDLFGRIRSLKDAALESYFEAAHNAHTAHITIVSEVANAYLQLVAYKELRFLAEETYETRKNSLKLTENQMESGVTSQMVLNQARTLAEEARVSAVQFRTYELQAANALALLLGAPIPDDMVIPSRLSEVKMLRDLPAGLPSQLLERRPDILAAEHALKSANANIGAARASFFPRIGLTANLGFMSTDLDNLFGGDQKTWSFVPGVSLPLFEGGKLLANLRSSKLKREIAVATYEKSIQTAFREVADSLAQRSTIAEQIAATKSLVDATKETMDMAFMRYEVGLDSYMDVLDAQRSYFSARQSQINSQLLREVNSLTLYKVLGGGWQ